MPEATPTHVVQALVTLAVVELISAVANMLDRLGDQGFAIGQVDGPEAPGGRRSGKASQRLDRRQRHRGHDGW